MPPNLPTDVLKADVKTISLEFFDILKYENTKMINLFKKLLLKTDNSKKFDARLWIQLALLKKNLKSLKY